ncbi:MAG: hypothetical protein LAN64_16760 [Acidobacteriia bacterium]|nr:hypothetical protein [Terriglobia bacterium]
MTYTEQLQKIVADYQAAGQAWPATSHEIAIWAISGGKWHPQRGAMIKKCAEELSDAMREEYFTDPQGRRVRIKHVARYGGGAAQIPLWADIRTATRDHMEIAFQQRRQQILGDCRQLKTDVDSYNENYSQIEPIQMVFDFTPDLAELELVRLAVSA